MNYFLEKIFPLLVDKLVIGLLLLIAGYWISRLIEKYKGERDLKKEYEVLRDKTALEHLQRQIEELYSPLLDLIQYNTNVYKIHKKKSKTASTPEEKESIYKYINKTYYLPLNLQIATLIREKIYLIDSDEMPKSFSAFLSHHYHYEILYNLWKDTGIRSEEIKGDAWDENLETDVADTLKNLINRYNKYLKKIENLK